MTDADYIDRFKQVFGESPTVLSQAPGRVNLLGEHVDYNDGLVLPFAIRERLVVTAAEDSADTITVHSYATGERTRFSLRNVVPGPRGMWENYIRGMVAGLQAEGAFLRGARLCIDGDLPAGRGLSSSAALCVSVGLALASLADASIPPTRMAQLARATEHQFVGLPCGIMDPYAVCHAQAAHVLLLDCRSLTHEQIPLDLPGYRWLLIPSGVHHTLAASAYATRVQECQAAVDALAKQTPDVHSLRDVTQAMLDNGAGELGPVLLRRARHVVTELDRVRRMAEALRASNVPEVGTLLWETQDSLRDDYEVSCSEVDEIIAALRACSGVCGARMVGGGFGGMILAMIRESEVDGVISEMARHAEQTARSVSEPMSVVSGDGASYTRLS